MINEKDAEQLADKVILSVKDKIKEDIADKIYNELSGYLYEHYQNVKDKIDNELIKAITEQYVKDPSFYKFKDLRRKMFDENKDVLVKTLTDEAIKDSVENVIMEYTHRNYHFNWQWKDGIVKIILKNWDSFKDDERIKEAFGRELDNRQGYIDNLKQQLTEIKNSIEE